MAATVGISYRLQLNHLNSEKKPVRSECLAFQVQYVHINVNPRVILHMARFKCYRLPTYILSFVLFLLN